MKIRLIFFVLLPILIAWGCIFLRVQQNDSLLLPDQKTYSWQIEAHVQVRGGGRTAKVELELPLLSERFELMSENFVSNGFAVGILGKGDTRKAVWSGYIDDGQQIDFYYRAQVQSRKTRWESDSPATVIETELDAEKQKVATRLISRLEMEGLRGHDLIEYLVKEVLKGDSDEAIALRKGLKKKLELRAGFITALLRFAGFPARMVYGIRLAGPERASRLFPWVQVYIDKAWHPVDIKSARTYVPSVWFPWGQDDSELVKVRGAASSDLVLSVVPVEFGPLKSKASGEESVLFSFTQLPVESQALYRLILVMPVGALVVAFLRCIVGIKTIGTFMPVLVALSFRETELFWGLLLYSTVIAFSLIARYFLEHLQLLVVPRLTATLTLVVMVILTFTVLCDIYHISKGLSVALFPIVILTMMVERISILFEELGLVKALTQTIITLLVSALVYEVLSWEYIRYYMFVFPELLLVVLSFSILIGRYTGFRLTELYRFRSFAGGAGK